MNRFLLQRKERSNIFTFMYLPAWRIIQTGGLSTFSPRRARSISGSEEEPWGVCVEVEEVEEEVEEEIR
jgi:hypothetical protein